MFTETNGRNERPLNGPEASSTRSTGRHDEPWKHHRLGPTLRDVQGHRSSASRKPNEHPFTCLMQRGRARHVRVCKHVLDFQQWNYSTVYLLNPVVKYIYTCFFSFNVWPLKCVCVCVCVRARACVCVLCSLFWRHLWFISSSILHPSARMREGKENRTHPATKKHNDELAQMKTKRALKPEFNP